MYINDLSDRVSSLTHLFAEDTILYILIATTNEHKTLQEDLMRLEQWEREWDVDFHPDHQK